jgi:hypothetical protein
MLVREKTTQKETIRKEIEANGWEIFAVTTDDWRENEVWRLESVRTPVGFEAFLIFENDPLSYDEKISEPWAVRIVAARPTANPGKTGDFLLSLKNKWQENLLGLIEYLVKLRNEF